jgi:cytoskeletal protein CcmA (bactofilin family)
MFGRRRSSIVGRGLQVVGTVTAEGLVKVYGQIDCELRCASLIVSRNGHVKGKIKAEKAIIDGKVEGPIEAADVILKSRAHVVGDIHHRSLHLEQGAYFEGRSMQAHAGAPDKAGARSRQGATDLSKDKPAIGPAA